MAKKETVKANYNDQSIKALKGADRVRKRPAVIFGSDGLEGCEHSFFEILSNSVDEAREVFAGTSQRRLRAKLDTLHELGIGYMTLGESTPALSGGEAQRLKLASEMGRAQEGTLFVFDEPTIGLHPLDVRTLIGVFQKLIDQGASVLVIEHDLDMIANADWIIDMGPGGGQNGGEIVATGTPAQVAENPLSLTGRYLKPCVE